MKKRLRTQKGYTLIEILIAIVIIGIGFLALIAVQLGALRGYISARDSLQSAEVGRRITEIVRAQGEQWVRDGYSGAPAYSGEGPFQVADPIEAAMSATGEWVSLYEEPADFASNRPEVETDMLGGKFCAFLRGGPMTGTISDTPGQHPVLQFQVAVVYAGPNATLNRCEEIEEDDLDDVGGPSAVPALEEKGLRASYYGTVVVRRSYLQDVI